MLLFFFLSIQLMCCASENSQSNKLRILISSSVNQNPTILNEFLESLKRLEKNTFILDYFFIDDNNHEESSQLLKDFSEKQKTAYLINSETSTIHYNELSLWREQLIWKVTEFKDLAIQKAISENYDYLFLIDSDIVLHPKSIKQLIESKKDIISNIFWSKNHSAYTPLPQVWFASDIYSIYQYENSKYVIEEEADKKIKQFLDMLHEPGVYKVGRLGSCTLINKTTLKKGISFKKIDNLPLFKDDSHFSIRASLLGLSLFVDTHYPAFHIHQDSDLIGLKDFKKKCGIKMPRITLSMIIHNEANRYLKKVLKKAKEYITDAVIIDDASTDNSAEVCLETLKGIPLHLVINTESKFVNEVELRKQQWEETIKTNPEWILILDADEIFEDNFKHQVKDLINSENVDTYVFRLYDFWDENHYRDNHHWQAHLRYFPFLIKYNPKINYRWKEQPLHCGRFPYTVTQLKVKKSDLRLKHYGWAKYEDRLIKYKRYQGLDPHGSYNWKSLESILVKKPNLIKWEE